MGNLLTIEPSYGKVRISISKGSMKTEKPLTIAADG